MTYINPFIKLFKSYSFFFSLLIYEWFISTFINGVSKGERLSGNVNEYMSRCYMWILVQKPSQNCQVFQCKRKLFKMPCWFYINITSNLSWGKLSFNSRTAANIVDRNPLIRLGSSNNWNDDLQAETSPTFYFFSYWGSTTVWLVHLREDIRLRQQAKFYLFH